MRFKKSKESRGDSIPIVRMMSPTPMSATGVSLEVNTDTMWLSPEEFMVQQSSAHSSNQSKARDAFLYTSDVAMPTRGPAQNPRVGGNQDSKC